MAQAARDSVTRMGMEGMGSIGDQRRRYGEVVSPGAHPEYQRGTQFGNPIEQLMQLLHMLGAFRPQGPRMPGPIPPTSPPPSGLTPEALQMLMARPDTSSAMIPRFQYGGVVTKPTVGLLGEAGPEAVVPLSGGTASPFGTQSAPPPSPYFNRVRSLMPQGGQPSAPPTPFDPNNPFAGQAPKGQLQTGEEMMGYLLRQAAQGGMFGQQGDPRITAMLRSQALQDATAQGRANRLGLLGRSSVDPSTFGFQSLMSDLNTQGQTANAMNQATLQQALAAQDWYRQMFGGAAGRGQQASIDLARQWAAAQQAAGQQPKFGLGDLAKIGGQLGAAAFGG